MSRQRSWMSAIERRHQARLAGSTEPARPRERRISGAKARAIAAVVFAALGLVSLVPQLRLQSDGAEADAVAVAKWTGHKSTEYTDVVFTTPQGRRVRASIPQDRWADDAPKIGSHVRIRFERSNPDNAADARQRSFVRYLPSAMLLGFAGAFAIWAYRVRRKKRAHPAPDAAR